MNHIAHKFAQIIWRPAVGDSVYWKPNPQGKWQRGKITKIIGAEFKVNDSSGAYMSGEVRYRPTPAAYEAMLGAFRSAFVYLDKTSSSHYIGAVSVNGFNVILRGRARKILISLLDLRGMDYRVNNRVNEVISTFRLNEGEKAVVIPIHEQSSVSKR